jgi:hypothetical protein
MTISSLCISSLCGGRACGLAYRVLDELDVLDVVLRCDEPPHRCTVRGLLEHILAHTIRHLRWEKVLCDNAPFDKVLCYGVNGGVSVTEALLNG